MKSLHRWVVWVALLAAFFIASSLPAAAQWQTQVNSVPIGRGGAKTGFDAIPPGAAGLPFVSQGAAKPAYQALGNSGLAQMSGNTVKCNPLGSTANVQDCASQSVTLVPDQFCTVDRSGNTDMGACINSAIAAAKSCNTASSVAGYSRVYLRAGTYLITTPIVPKSCTVLFGDGPGKTVLLTNSAAPFGPPSGQQLVHFTLDNLTFKEAGSNSGATAMTFPSLQDSRLTNLSFMGYTNGTLISLSTALVTTFDDSAQPWNNSNIIFNYFLNWQADSCANCIIEAGHYGTTPTGSPANSSNLPDMVVTANRFDNISMWRCSATCINFVKASDSEILTNIIMFLNNNNVAVQIGGDNANFPGNNYVNSHHLQIVVSSLAPNNTALTLFRFGDWTYGNVFDVETDLGASNYSGGNPITVQAGVTQANYTLCGKFVQGGANAPVTDNACVSTTGYTRLGNGVSTKPIFGFSNDTANGLYLVASGTAGWSKNVRVDGHMVSGALYTPTLSSCGTSPSFAGTASDTAGRVTVGSGPPTSCTLTFGSAFATAPVCIVTPVGATQQPYISAQSTSAITWSWAVAQAGQQFNYACLALPGG